MAQEEYGNTIVGALDLLADTLAGGDVDMAGQTVAGAVRKVAEQVAAGGGGGRGGSGAGAGGWRDVAVDAAGRPVDDADKMLLLAAAADTYAPEAGAEVPGFAGLRFPANSQDGPLVESGSQGYIKAMRWPGDSYGSMVARGSLDSGSVQAIVASEPVTNYAGEGGYSTSVPVPYRCQALARVSAYGGMLNMSFPDEAAALGAVREAAAEGAVAHFFTSTTNGVGWDGPSRCALDGTAEDAEVTYTTYDTTTGNTEHKPNGVRVADGIVIAAEESEGGWFLSAFHAAGGPSEPTTPGAWCIVAPYGAE